MHEIATSDNELGLLTLVERILPKKYYLLHLLIPQETILILPRNVLKYHFKNLRSFLVLYKHVNIYEPKKLFEHCRQF